MFDLIAAENENTLVIDDITVKGIDESKKTEINNLQSENNLFFDKSDFKIEEADRLFKKRFNSNINQNNLKFYFIDIDLGKYGLKPCFNFNLGFYNTFLNNIRYFNIKNTNLTYKNQLFKKQEINASYKWNTRLSSGNSDNLSFVLNYNKNDFFSTSNQNFNILSNYYKKKDDVNYSFEIFYDLIFYDFSMLTKIYKRMIKNYGFDFNYYLYKKIYEINFNLNSLKLDDSDLKNLSDNLNYKFNLIFNKDISEGINLILNSGIDILKINNFNENIFQVDKNYNGNKNEFIYGLELNLEKIKNVNIGIEYISDGFTDQKKNYSYDNFENYNSRVNIFTPLKYQKNNGKFEINIQTKVDPVKFNFSYSSEDIYDFIYFESPGEGILYRKNANRKVKSEIIVFDIFTRLDLKYLILEPSFNLKHNKIEPELPYISENTYDISLLFDLTLISFSFGYNYFSEVFVNDFDKINENNNMYFEISKKLSENNLYLTFFIENILNKKIEKTYGEFINAPAYKLNITYKF